MASLETKYLGLSLKSPVIVGSSPLTQNVVSLEKCEEAGAGAVVLKSIFEEQIESEVSAEVEANDEYLNFSSAHNVYKRAATDFHIDKYIKLLASAKKELSIPVIASVCCKSLASWSEYAERFVENGADAIELNYYPSTSDARVDGRKVKVFVVCFYFSLYFTFNLFFENGFEHYCSGSCLFTLFKRHHILCQRTRSYDYRAF